MIMPCLKSLLKSLIQIVIVAKAKQVRVDLNKNTFTHRPLIPTLLKQRYRFPSRTLIKEMRMKKIFLILALLPALLVNSNPAAAQAGIHGMRL
jgi:hypothetical protein